MSVHEDTAILNFSVDNYEQKLVRKLHSLAENEQFCDVALTTKGVTVHTHRAVLCSSSQYFATLFSDRWSPSVSHDVSYLFSDSQQLKEFVNFLYTGKIIITNENIDDILNAGTHLLVDDLRDVCAKYLAANLSLKNCLCIWMLSERYQLEEVSNLCKAIASSRFQDYHIHQEELMNLDPNFLEKIVDEGVLDMVSQEERTKFLLKWQKHQCDRELTGSLLKYIPERERSASGASSEDSMEVETSPPSPIHQKHFTTSNEDHIEAIFALSSRACSLDMYVYLKNHNQWRNLGTFTDSELGSVRMSTLVGFLGSLAIYDDGMQGSCSLVDFEKKSVKSLKCPTNGAFLKRHIFCLSGKIFLVQDSKSNTGGECNEIQLFILDPKAMEWRKEIAMEMTALFPEYVLRANVSYSVITSGSTAYIWAQDISSNISGPYWMRLVKGKDEKYAFLPLIKPPLSRDDLKMLTPISLRGWKHATFKFSVDAHNVHVYRNKILTSHSMTYDMILTYDTVNNIWSRKDNVTVDFPKDIVVPVTYREMASSDKAYVQLDQKCKIQSRLHGCTYLIEKACPFVARLWAHNLSDGTWEQMAPPPVEDIRAFESFSVISLATSVSNDLHGSTAYSGMSEDSLHSPMAHWELDVKGRSSKIELQSPSALMIQHCIHR